MIWFTNKRGYELVSRDLENT